MDGPRQWRAVRDGLVRPEGAACDQEAGGTITPSNPGGWTTATATEIGGGTYDIEWTNSAYGDGIRELAGISWPLTDLIPGADYGAPGQVFYTRLTLLDVTGVDLTSSPQFGFGVGRGTLGSGSEDGRIGGIGYAGATAAAPTIRFTTGQAFSGTIALGTYPIDGGEVIQIPARATGAEPMFSTNVCNLWFDDSGTLANYRVANSNYPNNTSTIAAAGTDRLFLLWGSTGAGLGAASQTARVKIEIRLIPWKPEVAT